ncbi:MAG: AAA family ATPase [Stackebrandtia sp.]
MPRLILINGAPGCGKSTLARRYADRFPLTLNLDIDLIRGQLGRWKDDPGAAGALARDIAVAAARTQLASGHNVRPAADGGVGAAEGRRRRHRGRTDRGGV